MPVSTPLRPMPRPFTVTVLAVLVAMPMFVFVATPSAADHVEQVPCSDPRGCPDLIVDASRFNPRKDTRNYFANSCAVQEGATEVGTRTLLRFTFSTPNVGAGDLIIGNPNMNPQWFTFGQCHGHFHFKEFSDYRLWTPAAWAQWQALRAADPDAQAHDLLTANPHLAPVRGDKMGFCVVDITLHTLGVPKYLDCNFQGISAGWADVYSSGLDGQWVDITGLPSGTYVLETEVNAERFYKESDYTNNRAWVDVTI